MCQNETFQKQTFVYSFDGRRLNRRNEYYMLELGSCPVTFAPFPSAQTLCILYTSSRICHIMVLFDPVPDFFSFFRPRYFVCVAIAELPTRDAAPPQQPRNDKMLKDWNGTWAVGITICALWWSREGGGEIRIRNKISLFTTTTTERYALHVWFLSFYFQAIFLISHFPFSLSFLFLYFFFFTWSHLCFVYSPTILLLDFRVKSAIHNFEPSNLKC